MTNNTDAGKLLQRTLIAHRHVLVECSDCLLIYECVHNLSNSIYVLVESSDCLQKSLHF